MPCVGRNVDEVPRTELDDSVLEANAGPAAQHDDPLAPRLVVPESLRRRLAVRNDPLDPHTVGFEKRREDFLGQIRRHVGEEIGERGHDSSMLKPSALDRAYRVSGLSTTLVFGATPCPTLANIA